MKNDFESKEISDTVSDNDSGRYFIRICFGEIDVNAFKTDVLVGSMESVGRYF